MASLLHRFMYSLSQFVLTPNIKLDRWCYKERILIQQCNIKCIIIIIIIIVVIIIIIIIVIIIIIIIISCKALTSCNFLRIIWKGNMFRFLKMGESFSVLLPQLGSHYKLRCEPR